MTKGIASASENGMEKCPLTTQLLETMKTKSTKPSKQTKPAIRLKDLAAKKNPKGGIDRKIDTLEKLIDRLD